MVRIHQHCIYLFFNVTIHNLEAEGRIFQRNPSRRHWMMDSAEIEVMYNNSSVCWKCLSSPRKWIEFCGGYLETIDSITLHDEFIRHIIVYYNL